MRVLRMSGQSSKGTKALKERPVKLAWVQGFRPETLHQSIYRGNSPKSSKNHKKRNHPKIQKCLS
jgi:hypothetical protein